ncbi:MAG: hypothetical protein GWN10_03495, partial [Nitrospinaceae bacterium]|nr:WbqC family protein [Nitrospinaceae bacterium]NIR53817.1 WbqC family protein [Nitrospinaceae bacterium]NIS84228.1 WbqC family protein [Nitrospinaceae bacterium]NIU95438.1 hypothetical protein [Nitrospinaceae bacterium]NIX33443.1 hypothetical protein [Nitrospinaceae bacterium]
MVAASVISLSGTKGSRILALCERLDARHYLSGDAAGDYLPAEEFRRRGIGLE